MVQIQGDWSDKPVDVLLSGIMLVAPDDTLRVERAKAAEQRTRAAETARLAAEQKAARQRELLASAPHPADGPGIRHVAAVAADILALTIQEKEFVPVPQVAYEPQAGDKIVRRGKKLRKSWWSKTVGCRNRSSKSRPCGRKANGR